jgi:hypothetical protein
MMFNRTCAFLALAFALFGTQCWAGTCSPSEEGMSCTNTFTSADTTGVYDFTGSGDGRLVVQFQTVLVTFTLTVTIDHTIDPIDPHEFPPGTQPVQYLAGQVDEYDFSGVSGGPNGVPVKGTDYKGLITLTLTYDTFQTTHTPAFGHAPGDNATAVYNEDILTDYFESPSGGFARLSPADPKTMKGKLPGLSAVTALDEPLAETDSFCLVSPHEGDMFDVGEDDIEIAFQLFSSSSCVGKPIRDKAARFSLSTTDSNGNPVFPRLRDQEDGKKFHSDDGVNESDLSTEGLAPGPYTITVWGSKFSPQTVHITLTPEP